MSEIKQFLRFEISGFIVIFYSFLFIIAFFGFDKVIFFFVHDNSAIIGFLVAAPIGFIIHEIDISIFNPFKDEVICFCFGKELKIPVRFPKKERYSISLLKKTKIGERQILPQMNLEFSKCLEGSGKFNFKYFEKEISNRYSYYYSRMEAGFFAPLLGLSTAILFYLSDNNLEINWIFGILVLLIIFILSNIILGYCGILLREIDDLECLFIKYRVNNYIYNDL